MRTYHVGAVSVLLGSLLLGSPVVQAEENVSLDSQPLETVVEDVAKVEETAIVPTSNEASVTPAEASLPAASTDKVETATSEKAGIETPDLAKEKAGDVGAIEEKVAEAPAIQEEAQKEPTVKEPTKVSVGNLSYLTENEKAEVRANVLAVNESATDVVVADNGTVTVYFGEKTLVLDASKTVKQKAVVSNRRLRSATVLEHDEIIIGADNFNSKVDLYGDASFNREKSVLELTPPISSKVGYVKLKDKIDISKSFNIDAKFNILQTNPNRSIGFDGISFILAPIDENRVGIGGAGLGISGLSDVLAVKIDTYSNPSEHLPGIGDPDYVEPGGDREIPHIAFVQTDGNGYMTPFNGSAKSISINYKENIWQDFNISYDENTQLMTATVGGKVIRIYLISYLDRIKEKYGSTKVSFLFSSSNFGHDSEPDTLNELKINRIDYYRERTVPRDNEQYEPAVSAGKALIDGSDAPNSPLSDADKEVVKAKVTIQPEAPVDTVISPANVISGTLDNPVVEVTVIYPDGTVDRVNVPVKQKDNEKYNPIVGKVTKPETDPVTAQDVMNQVTAPNGTQLTDKQVKGDLPTTVGTHDVPVEVTYPDGTKETVNVPVEITDVADKDQFDPIVGKVTKPETDPVTPQDVTDQVTAPNGTQLTDKQVKGDIPTTVGTHDVPVEVTYPDGTKETVNVPVEITDVADKDQF
ncbi:lectin-like domain-containing protein, partial [Streptococcus acidominimus]|uniref:lectin-like domain-containing protein n=1 Tax=Streptococcus acidominimus TaxID=1326 RepID=UPI0024131B99